MKKPQINTAVFREKFEILKESLSSFFENLKSAPHKKKYILLTIALTFLCLLLTFPYDVLVLRQLKKMQGPVYRSIQFDSFALSALGSLDIKGMLLSLNTGATVSLNQSEIDISTISLLGKRLKISAEANAVSYTSKDISAGGDLSLECDLAIDTSFMVPTDGTLSLKAKTLSINGVELQGFTLPPIKFSSINIDCAMKNGELTITNGIFNGKDLLGRIKGNIAIDKRMFNRSNLNLILEIDQKSAALDNYRMFLQSMLDAGGGKLIIRISGPLSRPRTELPGMGSPSAPNP